MPVHTGETYSEVFMRRCSWPRYCLTWLAGQVQNCRQVCWLVSVFFLKKMCTMFSCLQESISWYRASFAMWDHTLLPFSQHRWTLPINPQPDRLILNLPTP